MRVVVVGAGAIGLLLGSYLIERSINVSFLVRRKEQADLLREKGIQRIGRNEKNLYPFYVTTNIHELPTDVLWIVALKYPDVCSFLSSLNQLNMHPPLLFIQNGMAHYDHALKTKMPTLYFATVEHGARRIDDHTVSHNGVGPLTIAIARGTDDYVHQIVSSTSDDFPIVFATSAEEILLRKTLINCMINPLSAILQVRNGELIQNPAAYQLMKKLYKELTFVFPTLPSFLPFKKVCEVCAKTSSNQSSMLVDRLHNRQMETKTIITPILERAKERGVTTHLLSTLEQLLNAIEGKGI